ELGALWPCARCPEELQPAVHRARNVQVLLHPACRAGHGWHDYRRRRRADPGARPSAGGAAQDRRRQWRPRRSSLVVRPGRRLARGCSPRWSASAPALAFEQAQGRERFLTTRPWALNAQSPLYFAGSCKKFAIARSPFARVSLTSWCDFDLPAKEQEAARLEQESTQPDFWDDNRAAQATMARIAGLHEQTDHWREIARQVDDLWALFELAEADEDEDLARDIQSQAAELSTRIDVREFALFLSGEYDHSNAILAVQAGTGGVDSLNWTQMLLRMYLRWAEDHKLKTE